MSARISSAVACQVSRRSPCPADLGQLGGPVQGDPAHQLGRHVVLRLAPRLPDALVRFTPDRDRAIGLRLNDRPQSAWEALAAPGVEEDRVEDRAEHVVLALVERAVADPHRASARIPTEVIQRRLGQVSPAVDAVHDLKRAVRVRFEVGDELHELVGLPVEVHVVQRLQGEGRVPYPRVPVVPVPLPARRLGQRRGEGGDRRPGGHVGEALDRQRRPLDRVPPAVVGDAGSPEPGSPEADRGGDAVVSSVDVGRRGEIPGPREGAEEPLPRTEHVAGADPVALHADGHVGEQSDGDPCPGRLGDVAGVVEQPPFGRRHAAVEDRLADQFHLHLPVEALGRADQHVLGVVVGGRAGVWRDRVRPARRSHGQRVAYHHPARGRLPGRRQHVGAGLVRPRRRDMDTERTSRNVPAARSSRLPKTLGESNRGTHSQSTPPSGATRAPVWQSDRKAYSEIGVNGDGIAALWPSAL